ncbi:MAG: hypothetical protein CMM46_04440 [Rhodospirillaceae bacterium]|nr:hypothetical protein [Rhodospirillaceae bacterium]|tara:strand:+ start:2983 stop:3414 length:432 start_codon:yes stop_codon:yes gene_type:complete
MNTSTPPAPALHRRLGLIGLTLYGVGVTVGAGIYVLVGKVAGHAGEVALLAFLIAALVAVMSALSFAELSSRFPRSAGEAVYVREAFGKPALSFLVGLAVAASGLISAGALLVGSAGYIASFVALAPWSLIIILLVLLTTLAI